MRYVGRPLICLHITDSSSLVSTHGIEDTATRRAKANVKTRTLAMDRHKNGSLFIPPISVAPVYISSSPPPHIGITKSLTNSTRQRPISMLHKAHAMYTPILSIHLHVRRRHRPRKKHLRQVRWIPRSRPTVPSSPHLSLFFPEPPTNLH